MMNKIAYKKYWNVLVQRAQTGSKHIYELHLANRVDDKIKYYFTGSVTASNTDHIGPVLSGSYVQTNFTGSGNRHVTSGSNLMVGPWTGSFTEFRVWKEPMSGSDFLMHTFNYNSLVHRTTQNNLYGFVSVPSPENLGAALSYSIPLELETYEDDLKYM